MKIALLVQRFPYGGAESYVEEIAKKLHEVGDDVTIISSENERADDSNYNFKIIRLSTRFSIGEYSLWKGLEQVLEKERFDIVHANTYGYYHSDKAARLKKKLGYKLVMTSHGFTGMDLHKLKKEKIIKKGSPLDIFRVFYDNNIGKKTLLACDHLIALSKYDENFYSDIGIERTKISIIPTGIKNDFFESVPEKQVKQFREKLKADFVFVSVGELNWIKNHEMSLQAISKILEKKPTTCFIIIGKDGGEKENLQNLCEKLNIENRVMFVDNKTSTEINLFMRSSDLLLHTSFAEGLSTVLLEAAACGLPFITTPAGGNGYFATECQGGITIPFNDAQKLSQTITELMDSKEKLNLMSTSGQNFAQQLAWNKIFLKISNVYSNILNHQ